MKVRLVLFSILFSTFLSVAILNSKPGHSQNKADSTGNPLSKDEQDLLKEINEARAHPDVYAGYLEKLKPLFKGKIYRSTLETQEGWAAVEDAIAFLRTSKPQGPLNFSKGLRQAAATHATAQGGSGATGHKGEGGMIEDRVKPFGTWQGGIGENLSYGSESARERVLTWLIDDGFSTRGHRKRLLSADYKVAGLCCGPHPEYGSMCVLTLAGGFTDAGSSTAASEKASKATTSKNSAPAANANKSKSTGSTKPKKL